MSETSGTVSTSYPATKLYFKPTELQVLQGSQGYQMCQAEFGEKNFGWSNSMESQGIHQIDSLRSSNKLTRNICMWSCQIKRILWEYTSCFSVFLHSQVPERVIGHTLCPFMTEVANETIHLLSVRIVFTWLSYYLVCPCETFPHSRNASHWLTLQTRKLFDALMTKHLRGASKIIFTAYVVHYRHCREINNIMRLYIKKIMLKTITVVHKSFDSCIWN